MNQGTEYHILRYVKSWLGEWYVVYKVFICLFLFTSFLSSSWAMEEVNVDAERAPFSKLMAKLSISPDNLAAKKVLTLLEQQKGQEEINLSNKNLTPNDIKFVLAFLKNRPLKKLILSHNLLGDEGARLISEEFRYFPDLQVLNLGDNRIGDKGVHFIIKGLKAIPDLQQLDLSHNNIKAKGNKIICKLIDEKDYPQYIRY